MRRRRRERLLARITPLPPAVCSNYSPGHRVHWIQAKVSGRESAIGAVRDITVAMDGRIELTIDRRTLGLWTHNGARLRALWLLGTGAVLRSASVLAIDLPDRRGTPLVSVGTEVTTCAVIAASRPPRAAN